MRPTLISRRKRLVVAALDAVLFAAAYGAAYLIRLDLTPYPSAASHFGRTVLTVVVAKALIFGLLGTYRGLALYATLPDLLTLVRHSAIASTALLALFQILPGHRPYSRGVLVIDWLLTVALLSASRVVWRMYREGMIGASRAARGGRKRVLLVGAGRAGVAVVKDLMATKSQEVEVVGFVDDDPEKQGATLLGLPILGSTSDLPEIPRCRRIDQVIVAIPSASPRVLRRIAELCRGVRDFRVVPALESLLRGQAALVQALPVPTESFLSRDTVDLAAADLRRFFEDKTILVTGAGGSIGSELSRQLAETGGEGPRRLLLLDSAETPLYDVLRQTSATLGSRAVGILASVRDLPRMTEVLRKERPDVILHAAALKHVPLCEEHPLEAVATNACATSRLADLALAHGVAHFTLVSTDKAVAPSCVMGASKRAAESYVQSLAGKRGTRFAAVRFGNVLGSNGSVLPLFHEQIARGGPVTVTDPRATRFFMTIPEACGLILQATRVAEGGEIYILDMGEPVRVLDLAQNLIRLYGYEPGKDIDIEIIGLRPGEKLHESLLDEAEGAEPVSQAKLLRIRGRAPAYKRCRDLMAAIEKGLVRRDEREVLRLLHALVPTFSRVLAPAARTASPLPSPFAVEPEPVPVAS